MSGIKIGNIINRKGDAKIGHQFGDGEVTKETLDIEVGDIDNTEGRLQTGHQAKRIRGRKAWVWAMFAFATIITAFSPVLIGVFTDSSPTIDETPTIEQIAPDSLTFEIHRKE